jgi:lysophospholipase L1-like esterase
MRNRVSMQVLGLLLVLSAFNQSAAWAAEPAKADRWEPAIAKFEARDQEAFPAKNGLLFVGSSSIVGWDLTKSFPDSGAINRGFGGSQIADSVRYAERIVLPYEPRVVVFYAGDNDLQSGKTPQQVLADYEAFVAKVHDRLPKTRIVYIGIKPSIARWKIVDKVREANKRIADRAAKDERLVFVDVDGPMLGDDGRPRAELFKPDGLHLNDDGYALWKKLVEPHLK